MKYSAVVINENQLLHNLILCGFKGWKQPNLFKFLCLPSPLLLQMMLT